MEWSKKRKILYALAFFVAVILAAAYPVYQITHPAPTCFDKKQNGDEGGVDCGGSCSFQCILAIKPLVIDWVKAFPLGGTSYDLGAYIENLNSKAGLRNARYTFRVFDNAGQILLQKSGSAEIAPGTAQVLFSPHETITGNPDHADLVFNEDDLAHWVTASVQPSILSVKNQNLKNVDTQPRFDATLVNTDMVNDVANLTLGAIIYDANRNPIAVSQTHVDTLAMGGTQDVFFTWPNRFSKHTGGGVCTVPVDTMLVIDRSGSMDVGRKTPPEPISSAKNAAATFIDLADQSDKVGIVSFATTVTSPIDHELSLDHEAVKNTTLAIAVEKGLLQYTDLGDALQAALTELQGSRHTTSSKAAIVALTDGVANRPINPANLSDGKYAEEFAAQIATAARTAGIELYTIGLGADINEPFLRDRIATDAVHYYKAPTAADLDTVYKKISATVCKEEGFITDIVVTPRAIFAH